MKLEHMTIVPLAKFESEELLSVKPYRTQAEYYWTCSSAIILWCLQNCSIDSCTYIDADLFFYSDPAILIEEMGNCDVMITEHRYTTQYDYTNLTGIYCVQFMTFKNTPNGLFVLRWWYEHCLEWCYDRFEDGKYGDQKYLDDWPVRFKGVHVLQHLGGGLAPWNMQQYEFRREGTTIIGRELSTQTDFPVIFFHFHYFYSFKKAILREILLTHIDYNFPDSVRSVLYDEYIPVIKECHYRVKSICGDVDDLGMRILKDGWWIVCKRILKSLFFPNNYFLHWIEF